MKIEKLGPSIHDTKELLPQIVERIYSVCKSDPSFHLKDELEIIENKMLSIKQKIEKQDSLIKKSNEIKNDFLRRIEILNDENERKQVELLEEIGGN